MKNDCEICGEGFITQQVDFNKGLPVFYASCSHCKSDYQDHKHLADTNKAKRETIYSKSLAAIDELLAATTNEEFLADIAE